MEESLVERQKSDSWRWEKKFTCERWEVDKLKINLFEKGYNRLYPRRQVNSVYFDDVKLTSYYDNLLGISDRLKYRLRFYGIREYVDPRFEKKIKTSDFNTKVTMPFNGRLNDLGSVKYPGKDHLRPLTHVSYSREYYFNSVEGVRVTIDTDISYTSLLSQARISDRIVVVEFKSDHENNILNVPKILSINTRNSKYCKGISALGFANELY